MRALAQPAGDELAAMFAAAATVDVHRHLWRRLAALARQPRALPAGEPLISFNLAVLLEDLGRPAEAALALARAQLQSAQEALRIARVQYPAQLVTALPPGTEPSPALTEIRWMIEELRVSLYAHPMRTRYPVSVKRIQQAIDDLASVGSEEINGSDLSHVGLQARRRCRGVGCDRDQSRHWMATQPAPDADSLRHLSLLDSSCPGLSRASTSYFPVHQRRGWPGQAQP